MEKTKQYLEARIEQLRTEIAKEQRFAVSIFGLRQESILQELLTLKDLFDEEYNAQQKALNTITDRLNTINEILDRTNETI